MTDTQDRHQVDPKTQRRLFWGLLIFAFSLFVMFCVVPNFVDVPLRVSEETTVITEPFFPGSTRLDYMAVLRQRFGPDDPHENGFRMVVQAVGSEPMERGYGSWDQICQQLDINFHDPPTMPEYSKSRAILEQDDSTAKYARQYIENCAKDIWTQDQYQYMDEYINEISPVLDLLGEAVRQKSYFVPGVNHDDNDDVLLPCKSCHDSMLQQILIRANRSIRDNQFEAAWHDIVSAMRLGCHLRNDLFIVAVSGGNYYGMFAFDAAERLLERFELSEEQLRQCIEDVRQLPKKTTSVEEMAMCHHYASLGRVGFYANAPRSDLKKLKSGVPEWSHEYLGVDWNLVARIVNDYHDQKRQIYSRNLSPADMQTEIDNLEKKIKARYTSGGIPLFLSRNARSKHISLEFCFDFPFVAMEKFTKTAQARQQLLIFAFELEIEKRNSGRYPATLDFLRDRYTPEELTDPFTDDPYEYNPNTDGYRLFTLEGGVGIEIPKSEPRTE